MPGQMRGPNLFVDQFVDTPAAQVKLRFQSRQKLRVDPWHSSALRAIWYPGWTYESFWPSCSDISSRSQRSELCRGDRQSPKEKSQPYLALRSYRSGFPPSQLRWPARWQSAEGAYPIRPPNCL